jgi:hypothetical protein
MAMADMPATNNNVYQPGNLKLRNQRPVVPK